MKKPQKRSGIFEKPVHGEKPKFQGSLTALKNGGKHSYEPNEVTIVHTYHSKHFSQRIKAQNGLMSAEQFREFYRKHDILRANIIRIPIGNLNNVDSVDTVDRRNSA